MKRPATSDLATSMERMKMTQLDFESSSRGVGGGAAASVLSVPFVGFNNNGSAVDDGSGRGEATSCFGFTFGHGGNSSTSHHPQHHQQQGFFFGGGGSSPPFSQQQQRSQKQQRKQQSSVSSSSRGSAAGGGILSSLISVPSSSSPLLPTTTTTTTSSSTTTTGTTAQQAAANTNTNDDGAVANDVVADVADDTQHIVTEMEQLTVVELNKLTLKEREFVYDDIHGVAQPITETDDFLQSKLNELDKKLDQLVKEAKTTTKSKSGVVVGIGGGGSSTGDSANNNSGSSSTSSDISSYLHVLQTTPEKVTNNKFRLMFLRSDLFNVEKSAQRIIDYFYSKQQIWGFDKLCHDICYDDLDINDKIALHSGCMQLNPHIQDRAGRAILTMSETHRQFHTFLNRVS